MTAQVKAGQCIACVGHDLANVSIACSVFSQPMDKGDKCFRVSAARLPALDKKCRPILVFPLGFKCFHTTLPEVTLNSQVSCPIAIQDVSSTSNPCRVAQKRLSRIRPWVTKQIGCESCWLWAVGETWSTRSRSRSRL